MSVPTNYKMASDPAKSCATCANYNKVVSSCNKFVTYVDAGAVCDAFASMNLKVASYVLKAACDTVLGYRILKASSASASTPTAKQVAQAAAKADTTPTADQKKSGTYKKGHIKIHGLDITIENPKGSTRSGESKAGKKWSIKMKSHYGYIKQTEGKDGDHVDVLIGPDPKSWLVYVVDQVNPSTKVFDEHKCVLGCKSMAEAKQTYLDNYEKGWQGMGAVKFMIIPQFKKWLKDGDTTKPAAKKS